MLLEINKHDAPVFFPTHREDALWHMQHGVFCPAAPVHAPDYVPIGYPDDAETRRRRIMPDHIGGTLADWIGLYVTPRTPASYAIQTGVGVQKQRAEELVIFATTFWKLLAFTSVIVADRTPTKADARFEAGTHGLRMIDYSVLAKGIFSNDPAHPNRKSLFGAQVLVRSYLPAEAFIDVACNDEATRASLQQLVDQAAPFLRVAVKRRWSF